MYLERATEDYRSYRILLTTSKVKADIFEKLAETIYTYTAYPSSTQVSDVAEALVKKISFPQRTPAPSQVTLAGNKVSNTR